ncbi:nicotine N-demethylase CYP82E3-like isoform X2 [Solanum dulcamara]|uniref:nicotine N-demethylase CYP82E3-like isoform X2 n=1 Tax=Solanum dulcamara TaxID=45834 RepID=UPI002484FA11|nr:nicotine N-demethylase CYP82E3-like isoform X2 [Solanum dulcamara]
MVQYLQAVAIFLIFISLYMLWKTKIQPKNSTNKVIINLPPEIPGTHRAIIVNNWEIVKECFTTNDKVLAGRPNSSAGIYLGYNNAAFGFSDYGPYWRNIRKLVLLEVLSSKRLEQFKRVRVIEVETNIKELYSSILKSGTGPSRVNMSQWFEQLTLNVIMKMITGKRYKTEDEEGKHFTRTTKEYMYESVQFVLSDVIPLPFLKWFDFQGRIKSMKRLSQEMDKIVTSWIDEHLMKRELALDDDQDFIDVMLSKINEQFMYGYTRETVIKATILNIILAGSDTTSIHLTWLLSLLLNNKHVMDQAQEEIDTKIGKERWAEECDIKNLVYLQAIVKETLRLYPPGPLAIPHAAIEDCTVAGYKVPKGTRLMVNVWKLHRDPQIWSDPEKFMPERFLRSHSEFDVTGQNFEFIPFGSGRRSCPGITFAIQVTHLTLARLLQGFNFCTLGDMPVDMTEGNSITLPKANPLEVLLMPRLAPMLYQL